MVTKAEIALDMAMLLARGKPKSKITFHTEHKPEDWPVPQEGYALQSIETLW